MGLITKIVDQLIHLMLQLKQQLQEDPTSISPYYTYHIVNNRKAVKGILGVLLSIFESVLVVMGYVCIGGFAFAAFEGEPERFLKQTIYPVALQSQGFNATQMEYVGGELDLNTIRWDFVGAMRYSMDLITTIGYGNFAPETSASRLLVFMYVPAGIALIAYHLDALAQVMLWMTRVMFDFVIGHTCGPQYGNKAIERKIKTILTILDNCDQLSGQGQGQVTLPRPQLQRWMEECTGNYDLPPKVREVLDLLEQGGQGQVRLSQCWSRLTQYYRSCVVHLAFRQLMRTLLMMVFLCLTSIPIFMALESWSVGDAAWFTYITFTTIGLGDLTPTHNFGLIYWYYFVFTTLGLLSLAITDAKVVLPELLQRVRIRLLGLKSLGK
mmetsp:Transcript_92247/g.159914  ORF Transcript_92247/g.159914 Transcript_92247/m.159914 type:complete len:382 (-) Transcript_92247:9-1154(-)